MHSDQLPQSTTEQNVAANEPMMVSGEALACFSYFILNRFDKQHYQRWVSALSPIAQQAYRTTINKSEWYPLNEFLTEPTIILCNMFFNGSLRGAWECGRSSADIGLSGIKKLLVKLSKPDVLIERAAGIMSKYYKPSKLTADRLDENLVMLRITEFPECSTYVEHRIGGWVERALQICGCRHLSIQLLSSIAKGDQTTEYRITWKKY